MPDPDETRFSHEHARAAGYASTDPPTYAHTDEEDFLVENLRMALEADDGDGLLRPDPFAGGLVLVTLQEGVEPEELMLRGWVAALDRFAWSERESAPLNGSARFREWLRAVHASGAARERVQTVYEHGGVAAAVALFAAYGTPEEFVHACA